MIASKATTITFPGGGFLRDACNDASFSINGISPMQKPGPGGTSLRIRGLYRGRVSLWEQLVVLAIPLLVAGATLPGRIVRNAHFPTCAR